MKSASTIKQFVFIFIGLVCVINSIAQTDIRNYYKKTNLAELAICKGEFVLANKYYIEAFQINKKRPFNVDLRNAFFSAMDAKEYRLAESYLSKLMLRPVDSELMGIIQKGYQDTAAQIVDKMLKKYPNKTNNDSLVHQIRKIYHVDQQVRAYFTNLYGGAYMTDSVYTVDSINAAKMRKLFIRHNLPDELVVSDLEYDIVIFHNAAVAASLRPAHIFDTILFKAIWDFRYDARKFLHIVEKMPLSQSFSYNGITLNFPMSISGCMFSNNIYMEYWNDSSENEINKERSKLGLESLDDYRTKMVAKYNLPDKSFLQKYSLIQAGSVMFTDRDGFERWQDQFGKDARVRRSLSKNIPYTNWIETLSVGAISDWFVIGVTKYSDRLTYFKSLNKEYWQEKVTYGNWVDRKPPLPTLYHAEVIADPKADLRNDTARANTAKFIDGYKVLIEYGQTFPFGRLNNIEEVFDMQNNGVLISVTANVDPSFYKSVTRRLGSPTKVVENPDTVHLQTNPNYNIILSRTRFTWETDNCKLNIVVEEKLGKSEKKRTVAVLQLIDIGKYDAYLKKVESEKRRLEKVYRKR